MKKVYLILTILLTPVLGFSQFIGDTVVVYVENRIEMKIAIPDYDNLRSSEKITSSLNEFSGLLNEISDNLSPDSPDIVKYSPGKDLTIEPGNPKVIYLMRNGKLTDTGVRDQAFIIEADFQIILTTTDLSKISDLPLAECLNKVISKLPPKRNWSRNLYYECVEGQVNELSDRHKNNKLDFLELNIGVGAGLIKGNFVPELSLGIGIGFNKKGLVRLPYISSNMLFDFSSENQTNINTFLNLGYAWDPTKSAGKNDLLGFEIGYLVSGEGDLLKGNQGNTFQIGANWSPIKHVFVGLRLYLLDNFKEVTPGIRVGFGF